MAEKEGFEPPRRRRPPGFQDRSLQPDLGISPKFRLTKLIITHYFFIVNRFKQNVLKKINSYKIEKTNINSI